MTARVLGVGGVFFRSKDPARLAAWYKRHLGLPVRTGGGMTFAVLPWNPKGAQGRAAYTVWAPFPQASTYFGSKRQPVMINFVVKDLDSTLRRLRKERVRIVGDAMDSPQGRFAWIEDREKNRVELWEPPAR